MHLNLNDSLKLIKLLAKVVDGFDRVGSSPLPKSIDERGLMLMLFMKEERIFDELIEMRLDIFDQLVIDHYDGDEFALEEELESTDYWDWPDSIDFDELRENLTK